MKIREVWVLVAVLIAGLVLLLIWARSGEQPPIGSQGREPATVTLWHGLSEADAASLDAAVRAFRERNPGSEIEAKGITPSELLTEFERASAQGEGPTLLLGSDEWGPTLFEAGHIADLHGAFTEATLATLNEPALASTHHTGALLGLPHALEGVVLYRNRDLVPQAPKDPDQLIELARQATSGEILGANLETGLYFSAGHLYALGGRLMDEAGDPAFADEQGLAWLALIRSFKEAGPVVNYSDADLRSFEVGGTGLIIDGTWNLVPLASALGESALAVDPWPAAMSGFVQSRVLYLGRGAGGEARGRALALIRFLLSPEGQAHFVQGRESFLPASQAVEGLDPLRRQALGALQGGVPNLVLPERAAYWDPLNTAVRRVLEEGVDPERALEEALGEVGARLKTLGER